jgi:hypothetical protein
MAKPRVRLMVMASVLLGTVCLPVGAEDARADDLSRMSRQNGNASLSGTTVGRVP